MRKMILTACLAAPLLLLPAATVCAQVPMPQPQSGPMPNPPPPPLPPQSDGTQATGATVILTAFHLIFGM